jgi:hypothetical protein
MKTLRLLFLLPLAFFTLPACDAGPVPLAPGSEEPMVQVHTFPGMTAMAEDGQPLDRMEYRIPGHMLPAISPRIELDQGRWETIRQGKDWPRSVVEREALGMQIEGVCNSNERCDHYNNCDGTDTDGVNADGVDFTEYPSWSINGGGDIATTGNWSNCEVSNSVPYRCAGKYSAQRDYYGSHCLGCGTSNYLDPQANDLYAYPEQVVLFTGDHFTGNCARWVRQISNWTTPGVGPYGDTRNVTYTELAGLNSGLNDSVSSLLFSGHIWDSWGNGRGSLEIWEGNIGGGGCGAGGCWFNGFGTPFGSTPPLSSEGWGGNPLNDKMSSLRINYWDHAIE